MHAPRVDTGADRIETLHDATTAKLRLQERIDDGIRIGPRDLMPNGACRKMPIRRMLQPAAQRLVATLPTGIGITGAPTLERQADLSAPCRAAAGKAPSGEVEHG